MPESGARSYLDTVTLSNFALSGRIDVLVARYGRRAIVPQQVLDEIADGIVTGYSDLRGVEAAVANGEFSSAEGFSAEEREFYRNLLRTLSPGEASCVTLARTRGGVVVTDDRTARNRCFDDGVPVTGTIGILKACVLDGILSPREADDALRAMTAAGYYSAVSSISAVVR